MGPSPVSPGRDIPAEQVELIPSATLAASNASRAAKLAELSTRRAARALAVPTSEHQVRRALRAHGRPVCLFGEDLHDRRERLRAAMVAAGLADVHAVPTDGASHGAGAPDEAGPPDDGREVDEEYYVEGSAALRSVRLALVAPTLRRARERLARERKMVRNDGQGHAAKMASQRTEAQAIALARGGALLSSQYADTRPTSAICVGQTGQREEWKEGRVVVTGSWGGVVKVWSADVDAKCLQVVDGHVARVSAVCIPREWPGMLLTASADMSARMYRWQDEVSGSSAGFKHVATLGGHVGRVADCRMHPLRRSLLVTCSFDGTFVLHDDGRALLAQQTGHEGVYRGSFHPDGSLLGTCGTEGGLRVWDVRTGLAVMTMGRAHVGAATCVEFSGDGRVMVSTGGDHVVKVWDLRKKGCVRTIPAHMGLISGARFGSQNGDLLVTCSFDRSVKIWSARRRWALVRAHTEHHDKVTAVDCTADGRFIVTACYDKTWKLWGSDQTRVNGDNVAVGKDAAMKDHGWCA